MQALNTLHNTRQGADETVQHFAKRISKLVERANYDITDKDAIDRLKVKEFIYKSKNMAKLCLKSYTNFEDAVDKALRFEQINDLG